MSSISSSSSGGVGFVGLLTIALIVLKLLGKIDWPWLWVLSPVWITAILVVGAVVFTFGMAAYTGQLRGLGEIEVKRYPREKTDGDSSA